MDDNLVGYLLNSLDDDAHRHVEAHLAKDGEARHKLELLKGALEPLAADREDCAPPPDLVVRTLGRIAEHCSRDLPRAPSPARAGYGSDRPLWRRADVLVAASILLTVIGISVPGLLHLRRSAAVAECKEHLHEFHTALKGYHDQHGRYPDVNAEAPHNAAGMMVPMLIKAGLLSRDVNVRCPGNGGAKTCPLTYEEIKALDGGEFRKQAPALASCYAYSLGYRDGAGYHPPHFDPELAGQYPLMGDRPPRDGGAGNSPNHGGAGQNVLFQDGHVKFLSARKIGLDDDIYLNKLNKESAGLDKYDFVLGQSAASP